MSNDPVDGGTVTYHRAEWVGEVDPNFPWRVLFTPDDGPVAFTAEQGEAMGLTPPEPAPLVVTCNGHSIELSDQEAEDYIAICDDVVSADTTSAAFARLLRDARQDPQPASAENTPGSATPGEQGAGVTCTPAPDTASDIDFDALPIGTVVRHLAVLDAFRIKVDGEWMFRRDDGSFAPCPPLVPDNWEVVYQPAPLSPGECLRGLLAGRDDADELIEHAKQWGGHLTVDGRLAQAIGDAAREVHG